MIGTILLSALVPFVTLAAGATPGSQFDGFYHLSPDVLARIADRAHVRFEYRSDDRLVSSHEVPLATVPETSLFVPIPTPIRLTSEAGDLELLVYADGLLLARFDADSLRSYNRTIRRAYADQLVEIMESDSSSALETRVSEEIEICDSPCGGGCLLHQDFDCDGTINDLDNCWDDPNPDQADCDGDLAGDVCDVTDGIFEAAGPVKTCMMDKDQTWTWPAGGLESIFEHHVKHPLVDVTACGAPDRWNHFVRVSHKCDSGQSDQDCCEDLNFSILQLGDDPILWCGTQRDQDFCP